MAVSKAAEAGYIKEFTVMSNDQKGNISMVGGLVNLQYFESIMDNTVKVSAVFNDSGDSINGKTARSGLPIVTEEKVTIKIEDNNKNILEFSDKKNNPLFIKNCTPLSEDTRKEVLNLYCVSGEAIKNSRVVLRSRFDGKISDTVRKIVTEGNFKGLGSKKKLDIETTKNTCNKIPNNKHPFYWLDKFSVQAVSETNQTEGKSAGYFFFETSEGYFFKSIDTLLDQKAKKTIIYNESTDRRGQDIPEGYDVKALSMESDNRIDAIEKNKMGTFSNRIVTFDPFTTYYEVNRIKAVDNESAIKKAGKKLPKMNDEFKNPDVNEEFSRTTYYILDTGTLPTGDSNEQIKKSGEENFEVAKIHNQSMMRYNQLFSAQITITIPGDFSLHAGDAIFVDTPEIKDNKNDKVDTQQGGLYIISDLCHYISPQDTLTKINLVRDTFGRKPKTRG